MRRALALLGLVTAAPLAAQEPPRLAAIYPAGGKVGTTVEVTFRGGVAGARSLLVFGQGVTGSLEGSAAQDNPELQTLVETKCVTCHELRTPANRQLNPQQWEQTIDRMINQRGADLNRAERDKIVAWFKARAAEGPVKGTLTIAPDARPGRREIRVVTPSGASTAFPFYVSATDELLEQEPNNRREEARTVTLPVVINAVIDGRADVDFFRFEARAGQRLLLRATAYQLNEEIQNYFDPVLTLYDAEGKRLDRNFGYDALDPLLDFTAPADGTYYAEVRDLMYRSGGANVYRLTIGPLGYKQAVYPLGGPRGGAFDTLILSENLPPIEYRATLPADLEPGLQELATPHGVFRFHVGEYPEYYDDGSSRPQRLDVPAIINGWLSRPGEKDRYILRVADEQVRLLRRWHVVGPLDAGETGTLSQVFPPETDVLAGRFQESARYDGRTDQIGWEAKLPDGAGQIVFPATQGRNRDMWYAYHAFTMTEAADATLALGTDDGCKVWVNGEVVHTNPANRPSLPADDLIPVRLRRGANWILLKIINTGGPGGFTAAAGAFGIEVYARRLGSPLRPTLNLGFGTDWLWQSARNQPERPGGDLRFDWSFTRPGEYGLEVGDQDNGGGDRYAYRIQVAPSAPELTLTAFPANPGVPRGGQLPVVVKRNLLSGFSGDVRVRLENLPEGLTASEAILPVDRDEAILILQAAQDAPAAFQPVEVVAELPGPRGVKRFVARTLDHYRVQNNPIPINRRSMVAGVLGQPAPYQLEVTPARLAVEPGGSAEITINLKRRPGFGGEINLVVWGLPEGVRADSYVLRGNQDTAKLQIRFEARLRDGGFGASRVEDAYRFTVVGLSGGDGLSGGLLYCSNPVALLPYDPARPTARPRPQTTPTPPATMPALSPAAQAGRRLMQQQCARCHAFYDPEELKKTLPDWTATVDRMIGKGARLNNDERAQVLGYLRETVARQQR